VIKATTLPLTLAVLLLGPASAAELTSKTILGCWRHDEPPTRCEKPYSAYQTLCFLQNGKAEFRSFSPEGASEDMFRWRMRPDAVVIDEQTCFKGTMDTSDTMNFARCLYMGTWRKQP
jgi:hypothetical protein